MMNLKDYYVQQEVRQRMVEFLGGHRLEDASWAYMTADDSSPGLDFRPRPLGELVVMPRREMDVKRSLWDRRSLVIHLDIEYGSTGSQGRNPNAGEARRNAAVCIPEKQLKRLTWNAYARDFLQVFHCP